MIQDHLFYKMTAFLEFYYHFDWLALNNIRISSYVTSGGQSTLISEVDFTFPTLSMTLRIACCFSGETNSSKGINP
jgi:hypothetical protein